MSEIRKHDIYKIDKESEDFKKVSKILDRYIQDVDLLMIETLEKHIFSNGISDIIKEKISKIEKAGKDKIKL